MLDFKALLRNAWLICLTLRLTGTFTPAMAQPCYGADQEVKDSRPCCEGYEKVTEVDTGKTYCDKPMSSTTRFLIWGMILVFPMFLLIFAIFGLRNKMMAKRAQNNQPEANA